MLVSCGAASACEVGGPRLPHLIPGPFVPSPTPTEAPYVWETSGELALWVDNVVSRGALSIEGSGSDAYIRIETSSKWVLRGPDLDPPASGVLTVRVRSRWRPGRMEPGASLAPATVAAYFEVANPLSPYQPSAGADVPATDTWTEIQLERRGHANPLDVRYAYFSARYENPGILAFDAIELVQP